MEAAVNTLIRPDDTSVTKADSTRRFSRAVPHRGTNRAFRCLTSEFKWDRVFSTKYGRQRRIGFEGWSVSMLEKSHRLKFKCRVRGSNRRETKEGCAERIARCGTLSQNGYGDHSSARAGVSECRTDLGVQPTFTVKPGSGVRTDGRQKRAAQSASPDVVP